METFLYPIASWECLLGVMLVWCEWEGIGILWDRITL